VTVRRHLAATAPATAQVDLRTVEAATHVETIAASRVLGVVAAVVNGRIEVVTQAAFASAQGAVEVCLGLIGTMALWLGLLRIAEKAGMVRMLARLMEPLTVLLFPSLPRGHPALGAIIMNLSANILGLGNAATPFGLRAMKEMQGVSLPGGFVESNRSRSWSRRVV